MSEEEKAQVPAVPEETALAKEPEYPWLKMSEKAKQGLQVSQKVQKTKHGLFANIPIICKASQCPYCDTCAAYMSDMAPEGEPCVVEIALLLKLYDDYTKELQIDTTQIINLGLIKSLIDAEITINRCNAILARDADILKDTPIGMTPQGRVITKLDAHPALAIRDKAYTQRNNAYSLLNSTPKDKAKTDQAIIIDPSTYATRILRKSEQLRREQEELERKTINVEAKPARDDS